MFGGLSTPSIRSDLIEGDVNQIISYPESHCDETRGMGENKKILYKNFFAV